LGRGSVGLELSNRGLVCLWSCNDISGNTRVDTVVGGQERARANSREQRHEKRPKRETWAQRGHMTTFGRKAQVCGETDGAERHVPRERCVGEGICACVRVCDCTLQSE